MLKITEMRDPSGSAALVLEGRLVGPWVDELRRVAAESGARGAVTLDLGRLDFVDREGLVLLRGLRRAGVGVDGTSDFVKVLLGGGDDGDSGDE